MIAPSVTVLSPGRHRFGFALFAADGRQAPPAKVALYAAPSPDARARGPYLASVESLDVPPAFRSRTTAADPDRARLVYVAYPVLPAGGRARVLALARDDAGRLLDAGSMDVRMASSRSGPPQVGERAISVPTPTLAEAAGNVSSIETRVPPAPSLLRDDLVDVLGRRPVVLVFATPQLCQSKVCGPVVDIQAQVQARFGDRASFIHVEIYRNNRPADGFREAVRAWRLPTEPWAFVIDRSGRISARFEGAFSAHELSRAVDRVVQ